MALPRPAAEPRLGFSPLRASDAGVELCAMTDIGRVRPENQDHAGLFAHQGRWLLVVADGMGGHRGGWEAAQLAVSAAEAALRGGGSPEALLQEAVEEADRRIHQAARADPELTGMGSTLVMALVEDREAWIAHVGDSRAYLVRGAEVRPLTRDHSQANRMIDAGLLEPEDAAGFPSADALARSLGSDEAARPELAEPLHLEPGDRLLLCTDGFSRLVEDAELPRLLSGADLEADLAHGLGLALLRGAPDNATVAALRVAGPRKGSTRTPTLLAGLVGVLVGAGLVALALALLG